MTSDENTIAFKLDARSGSDFSFDFDPYAYLALNPDVFAATNNDLEAATRHYILFGRDEGRPASGFNAYSYIAFNPDVFASVGTDQRRAVAHFVQSGYSENRPVLGFDPYSYLAVNPDLFAAFGADPAAAVAHFVRSGMREERPIAGFDPYAYMALNPDLVSAFGVDLGRAISHYIAFGEAEGRPATGFSPDAYLAVNPDLFNAFGLDRALAVAHYAQYGAAEGRPTGTIDDPDGTVPAAVAGGIERAASDMTFAIQALAADRSEGNAGTTAFTFTITRAGSVSEAASVTWAAAGSGSRPASSNDFAGTTQNRVTFAANERSKTITVNVAGDTAFETDETFTVTLSNPSRGTIATARATGTIRNDDPAPPTISIAATTASRLEGNSGAAVYTFTLSRSGDVTRTSAVSWQAAGTGTNPTNAADLTGTTSGRVTFGAGERTRQISVSVAGDTAFEADETFAVVLSGATGAVLGTSSVVATVRNDDQQPPPPVFSVTAVSADKAEGAANTSTAYTFAITRSGDVSRASSVQWSAAGTGGNPTNASDLTGVTTGTVAFAKNVSRQIVTVYANGDTSVESDETFALTLSNPTGATVGSATATGTIRNDDAMLSIAATSAEKNEGQSGTTPFTFTVTRTGDASRESSVTWQAIGSGSNPTSTQDFEGATSSRITFAKNERTRTVTVNVKGDRSREADETFSVKLSAAMGAALGTSSAVGTIKTDDTPLAELRIKNVRSQAAPGNPDHMVFRADVERSGLPDALAVVTGVDWKISGYGTSAAAAIDFVGNSFPGNRLLFAADETSKPIEFTVKTQSNAGETFKLALSNPSLATLSGETSVVGLVQKGGTPYFVNALESGYRWNSLTQAQLDAGQRPTLKVGWLSDSFPGDGLMSHDATTFTPLGDPQKLLARDAFQKWSAVTGITFEYEDITSQASYGRCNIRLGGTNMQGAGGHSGYPNLANGTNAYIATTMANGIDHFNLAAHYLHEIGHALGLKHPGPYNATGGGALGPYLSQGPSGEDQEANTVMSYRGHGTDLGDFDIAAIQFLYGPNPNGQAGNTTHTMTATGHDYIWDGSGADTLSASAETAACTLDLRGGSWCSVGARTDSILAAGQYFIGYRTVIENATGGSGNDTITGNDAVNSLVGGAGDDLLVGGAGADSFTGGAGADAFRYLAPGDGGDTIADFQTGTDRIEIVGSAFGGLSAGGLAASRFALNNAADADDRFVFQTSTGGLYYDANGNGAGGATLLATLSGVRNLTAGNILVVAG